MATPYSSNLSWNVYKTNPNWYVHIAKPVPTERPREQAIGKVFKESIVQGIQFVRDLARLIIKVPIRLIRSQSWQSKENASVNAKLAGYSFVRFAFVPAKLIITISALFTSIFSKSKSQTQLEMSEHITAVLNGRTSQLEALKEEGIKNAQSKLEYLSYKDWIYQINPELCR